MITYVWRERCVWHVEGKIVIFVWFMCWIKLNCSYRKFNRMNIKCSTVRTVIKISWETSYILLGYPERLCVAAKNWLTQGVKNSLRWRIWLLHWWYLCRTTWRGWLMPLVIPIGVYAGSWASLKLLNLGHANQRYDLAIIPERIGTYHLHKSVKGITSCWDTWYATQRVPYLMIVKDIFLHKK